MMVTTEYGARKHLANAIKTATPPSEWGNVHLYTNEYTPTTTSVKDDFEEATFTGSDPIMVLREDWTDPATVGGKATSTAPETPLVWTNTGSEQTVTGYFVCDPEDDDEVMFAEEFGTPLVVPNGEDLKITLKITDRNDAGG